MAQSDSCKLFPIVARNSHCFYLQALYLQNNKIKQLPSSIGSFKNLQTLNVSGNNLKEIPTTLSQLDGLKNLDVSNNAKLVKLPKELGHLRSLESLTVDTDVVTYPGKEVTKDGTEAIMRFFCSGKQNVLFGHKDTSSFVKNFLLFPRERKYYFVFHLDLQGEYQMYLLDLSKARDFWI